MWQARQAQEPAAQAGQGEEDGVSEGEIASFACSVAKVQTLADGGIRVTLDMAEDEVEAMARLVEAKRLNVALRVTVTQDEG